MTALIDTGFMLAVLDADDAWHAVCAQVLVAEPRPVLPEVVLPELAFMLLRELGYPVLIKFGRALLAGELVTEPMTPVDLARTLELLEQHADNRIDFVDCAVAALAERLEIQRVLTVDRRHFQLFRPKPWGYFDIAP
jgi:hypothetical protein